MSIKTSDIGHVLFIIHYDSTKKSCKVANTIAFKTPVNVKLKQSP